MGRTPVEGRPLFFCLTGAGFFADPNTAAEFAADD
jgi:hypothetical protein